MEDSMKCFWRCSKRNLKLGVLVHVPPYYFFLQFLSWQKKNLSRDIFAHSIHKCVKLEDPLPDLLTRMGLSSCFICKTLTYPAFVLELLENVQQCWRPSNGASSLSSLYLHVRNPISVSRSFTDMR